MAENMFSKHQKGNTPKFRDSYGDIAWNGGRGWYDEDDEDDLTSVEEDEAAERELEKDIQELETGELGDHFEESARKGLKEDMERVTPFWARN